MTYRYITNNDVDETILLTLSWDDLRDFCYSNKQTNHFCHNNTRLRQNLHDTSVKVLDVIDGTATGVGVKLTPTNKTIDHLIPIMSQYQILMLPIYNVGYNNIIELKVFHSGQNEYFINYKVLSGGVYKKYSQLATYPMTKKQLKDYLFHLFFDHLFE